MGLLNWLGIRVESPPEAFHSLEPVTASSLLLAASAGGDNSRLGIAAVYRGSQILADLTAQLPWFSVRGGKQTGEAAIRTPEVIDPQPSILVNPSRRMTQEEVVRELILSLVFRGNAYVWLADHDPTTGFPRRAEPINPDRVTVEWANSAMTVRKYKWDDRTMSEGFDFLAIPFLRFPGWLKGLGPLDAGRLTIDGINAAETYGRDFFTESATPAGTLTVPGKLTKDEATALRKQWEAQHADTRATAILSGGVEYTQISLSPEQAQYLQTRAYGVQEVARLLGIPAHLLGAGGPVGSSSTLTYTTEVQVFRELTRLTLAPTYLHRIEEAFSKALPRGQRLHFDTTDLLRTDDEGRFRAWDIALRAGILTVDEVRQRENLGPSPSASNTVPDSPRAGDGSTPDTEDERINADA